MCESVGAVAQRNITPILIEGCCVCVVTGVYDSAGGAVLAEGNGIHRVRAGCKGSEFAE